MFILLVIIHVIVCLILIATILLQAGRGGGLTEAFGDSTQSVLGSQASVILKRATEVSAVAFLITSLLLGMVTTRRGRSLFERTKLPMAPVQPVSAGLPGGTALPTEEASAAMGQVSEKTSDMMDKAKTGTEEAAAPIAEESAKAAGNVTNNGVMPEEQPEDSPEL